MFLQTKRSCSTMNIIKTRTSRYTLTGVDALMNAVYAGADPDLPHRAGATELFVALAEGKSVSGRIGDSTHGYKETEG